MKKNILTEIAAHKRHEIAALKAKRSVDQLLAAAKLAPPARPFAKALRGNGNAIRLIAEIKKASPSAGLIREDFNPPQIARSYEAGGAAAISVLTDEKYFQGNLEDMREARRSVDLPVLRKDFTLDAAQIYEARAAGADCVLLIVKMLSESELAELLTQAGNVGLDALVEVHNQRELDCALIAGAELVGINNRDLTTFEVDLETTLRLAGQIPDGVTVVSESGIRTSEDVARLRDAGVHAVLVGESLMRQADVEQAVRELMDFSGR